MASANGFAIVTSGVSTALRAYAPRVEKTKPGNDLRNQARRPAGESVGRSAAAFRSGLSQYETPAREPLWNGPQLNAAFVAQLIGQIVPGAQPASAPLAYRQPQHAPRALVFDALA
jgi:hypothetical protein